MQEALLQHFEENDANLLKAKVKFETKLCERHENKRKVKDFNFYNCLGKGAFGQVYLVKYKNDPETFYALKIMEKRHIIESKQLVHIQSELQLLNAIDNYFIIKMSEFFMDNVHIYLVMQYAEGGDIFTILRAHKRFEESLSKFYASQVVLALEYMHYMGIVYRDLKPENLLMTTNGYIKITDLGFSKKIDQERTYTLCGTPDYIAPEAILGQGYNYSVDWWSLGVLIFEMIAGCPPFYSTNPLHTYEKIISGKYICPAHFSRAAKDMVNNLLQVDRNKRFGVSKNTTRDIKSHGWFNAIKWNELYNQSIVPNFKPKPNIPPAGGAFSNDFLRHSDVNEFKEEFKDLCI